MQGEDIAENASSSKTSGLATLFQQCFAERRREMGDIFGGKTRFRTDLCEAEDIVNEEQHILTLSITEVLSNSQPCKDNTAFWDACDVVLQETLREIRCPFHRCRHTTDNAACIDP